MHAAVQMNAVMGGMSDEMDVMVDEPAVVEKIVIVFALLVDEENAAVVHVVK